MILQLPGTYITLKETYLAQISVGIQEKGFLKVYYFKECIRIQKDPAKYAAVLSGSFEKISCLAWRKYSQTLI